MSQSWSSSVTFFSGVSSERVHEAEGSQILTQSDALLHGQDAVGGWGGTRKQTM